MEFMRWDVGEGRDGKEGGWLERRCVGGEKRREVGFGIGGDGEAVR